MVLWLSKQVCRKSDHPATCASAPSTAGYALSGIPSWSHGSLEHDEKDKEWLRWPGHTERTCRLENLLDLFSTERKETHFISVHSLHLVCISCHDFSRETARVRTGVVCSQDISRSYRPFVRSLAAGVLADVCIDYVSVVSLWSHGCVM